MINEENPFSTPPPTSATPTAEYNDALMRNDGELQFSVVKISLAIAAIYVICILAYTVFLPENGIFNGKWTINRWRDLSIVVTIATLFILATLAFARRTRNQQQRGNQRIASKPPNQ